MFPLLPSLSSLPPDNPCLHPFQQCMPLRGSARPRARGLTWEDELLLVFVVVGRLQRKENTKVSAVPSNKKSGSRSHGVGSLPILEGSQISADTLNHRGLRACIEDPELYTSKPTFPLQLPRNRASHLGESPGHKPIFVNHVGTRIHTRESLCQAII